MKNKLENGNFLHNFSFVDTLIRWLESNQFPFTLGTFSKNILHFALKQIKVATEEYHTNDIAFCYFSIFQIKVLVNFEVKPMTQYQKMFEFVY